MSSIGSETVDARTDAHAIHPLHVRITHWINALAILVMVMSGWEIYNASPLFGFTFPQSITLGGWLAGALLWHFAAMWKPVQLRELAALFGGYEGARLVHFFAMVTIVLFALIHIVMALLVPRSLRAMIKGR